jgi:inhibitor of cysteine peptidase
MARVRRAMELGLIGIVLVGSLIACAPKSPAPLEVGSADAGSIQTLAVGQQLRVSLDSNPTTGYRWAVDGTLPPGLEQMGESKYTARSSAIGAGGVEVWTFIGKSVGTGTLKLKYWRSFEPTVAPVKTFEVGIDVR